VTHLRKAMLEELQRRNLSQNTKTGGNALARLPSPNDAMPAAFKSLAELLFFWEVSARSVIGGAGPFQVYSINSVHPQTAVCVCWCGNWLLYPSLPAPDGWGRKQLGSSIHFCTSRGRIFDWSSRRRTLVN
jgi:hypothetical protein